MSPLSHNSLSIMLCPAQVALLRTASKMTLRGSKSNVLRREVIPSETEGEMPWSGAIWTLGSALPRFIVQRDMRASVILSNHFVRYMLVPWCDNLSDEEEAAYARHCFKEMYGDASDAWELRISPNSAGAPALASAVDTRLLDELRELMGRMGLSIKSIRPHLMVAFNSCLSSLHGRKAWLALLEPGNLCLAVLQDGQFSWMRSMRIGDAWHEELPRLLEREAYLADTGTEMNEVLLWAPQLEDKDIPAPGRWNIQHLKPGPKSDRELGHDVLRNSSGGMK